MAKAALQAVNDERLPVNFGQFIFTKVERTRTCIRGRSALWGTCVDKQDSRTHGGERGNGDRRTSREKAGKAAQARRIEVAGQARAGRHLRRPWRAKRLRQRT